MKTTIYKLEQIAVDVYKENAHLTHRNLSSDTLEQTNALLIDKIFADAQMHIDAAIANLRILNNQLY